MKNALILYWPRWLSEFAITVAPFELTLNPSRLAIRLFWLAVAGLTLALWCTVGDVRSGVLVALLSGLLLWWARRFATQLYSFSGCLLLGYDGCVILRLPHQPFFRARLANGCLVNDWCCRLQLVAEEGQEALPVAWRSVWLWRDSLSPQDYRRLARCLLYRQHSARRSPSDQGA